MKNKTMRIAAVLLALTMMTSCFVGGTFAKYTTAGSSSDTARVAKWGVKITGVADIFSETYNEEDALYNLTAESVISNEPGKNVVAPGTAGTIADITIGGTPEVAARVEHKVSNISFDNWLVDTDADEIGDTFYCPMIFTIGTTVVNGADYIGNEAGLINHIVNVVAATHDVAPNVGLTGAQSLTITWSWPYEVNDLYNKYDTFLGDQAADGNAAKVTIEVTTSVTQIN